MWRMKMQIAYDEWLRYDYICTELHLHRHYDSAKPWVIEPVRAKMT